MDPKFKQTKLFANVVNQTGEHVMVTDVKGIILYVNPAFETTTGYAAHEVVGKNANILKSGHHDHVYYEQLWTTILAGHSFFAQTTNCKKSGELYVADQTITPIKSENGTIEYFVSIWKDITEKIRFQKELEKLNAKLFLEKRKLEEILSFDENVGKITNLNKLIDFIIQKSCQILDSERCSIMFLDTTTHKLCLKGSTDFHETVVKNPHEDDWGEIAHYVLKSAEPLLVEDIENDERFHGKNKQGYVSKSFMSVPIWIQGEIKGIVNITEKKEGIDQSQVYSEVDLKIFTAIIRQASSAIENVQLFQKLNFLTITDPLTQIYNYRYLTNFLEQEIKRSLRTQRPLAMMMIDIDHFKAYNDLYGHPEGDALLKSVAKTLVESVREIDVVCRYAGDEFTIILPETTGDQAVIVAKRVLPKIKALSLKAPISISIGVAVLRKGMDRRAFIVHADNALYQAKKNGKDQFYIRP